MAAYFSTLTATGQTREAAAHAAGTALIFAKMAIGSGDPGDIDTMRNRTTLVKEEWRGDIKRVAPDKNHADQLVIECIIPADVGGWWMRELLVLDSTGAPIAIARIPDSYKPTSVEGATRTQLMRMVVKMSYASVVTLMMDPNLVTHQDILDEVEVHEAKADPHPQYLTAAEGDQRYDAAGAATAAATAARTAHEQSADPHSQYTTPAEAAAAAPVQSVVGQKGAVTTAHLRAALAQDFSGKADLVNGQIPAAQLPGFVDDVLEFANLAAFPGGGESGKLYVAIDTGKTYRWSGSGYIEISGSPGSTDAVTEGANNLYFTYQRVRGTVLTGLSVVTAAAISASDTLLGALAKLQAQLILKLNALNPESSGTWKHAGNAEVGGLTATLPSPKLTAYYLGYNQCVRKVVVAGETTKFYPHYINIDVLINGFSEDGANILTVEVCRPSIHEDFGGAGSYNFNCSVRAAAWGNSSDVLVESLQLTGGGSYTWGVGHIAPGKTTRGVFVWLRGGMTHTIRVPAVYRAWSVISPVGESITVLEDTYAAIHSEAACPQRNLLNIRQVEQSVNVTSMVMAQAGGRFGGGAKAEISFARDHVLIDAPAGDGGGRILGIAADGSLGLPLRFQQYGGPVLVGNPTNDGSKLQIEGNGYFTGALSAFAVHVGGLVRMPALSMAYEGAADADLLVIGPPAHPGAGSNGGLLFKTGRYSSLAVRMRLMDSGLTVFGNVTAERGATLPVAANDSEASSIGVPAGAVYWNSIRHTIARNNESFSPFADNDFFIRSDGRIEQFGVVNIGTVGGGAYAIGERKTISITFPTSFPHACRNVEVTAMASDDGVNGNGGRGSGFLASKSLYGAEIGVDSHMNNYSANFFLFWRAIGD